MSTPTSSFDKHINSWLCMLFLIFPIELFAQDAISIPKVTGTFVFDGKLEEPFWSELNPLDMVMYQPVYRGQLSEDNEIYLVYDHNYIYLAANLYYKNVKDLRSNSLYRDQYSSDDTFALILDTFNDNENALWFFTNPAGVRFDVLVSNDAENNNFDWNTYWEVLTHRTGWGWSVEMRIPFSSLGFQRDNNHVIMGAEVYRFLSKRNERYVFPDIPPKWDNGFRKPSLAQKIRMENINSANPVYVTPYVLGGFEHQVTLNSEATAYKTHRHWTHEPGVDVKLNLNSNITLDLTANTDFAQVEADNQQVNLTRFPLFFPEKRQFFQERSSVFDFGFSRRSRLFHSRKIGLSSGGKAIRIYGGMRLVGKIKKTDIGFINMQTAASTNLPSENFGVLRIKKKIINRYSSVGGMFTSRIGNGEDDNFAYGLDAHIRVIGDEYLTLKWAQTYNQQAVELLPNSRIYFQWERRRNSGISYELEYDRTGADFFPAVGFTPRRNFSFYQNRIEYRWITESSPVFQEVWINNLSNLYVRNGDSNVETGLINPHAGIDTKGGSQYRMQVNIRYENLLRSFSFSNKNKVQVPAGNYWYRNLELSYEAPNGWKFRPGFSSTVGQFYDGNRSTIGFSAEWYISPHFQISDEYEYNKIRFKARNQRFTSHLNRLRFRFALDTHLSLTTFAQYNSEIEKTSINARFRYNFEEGNDLWIVYDNVLNNQRTQNNLPRLPVSGFQALLLKFTYTFKFQK
ncbi:MAG: DUF5916 domain-containing protein [Balneolaceae bacterium]